MDILTEDGYTVCSCLDGEQALNLLGCERFDLVLADVKMPRLTGLDLLRRIRETDRDTKVIIMTAFASLDTAIEALRNEASDYLIKPFSLSELRQRVQAALVEETEAEAEFRYLALRVDVHARRAWLDKREVELTRQEFELLAHLFRRKGYTVSWQELLHQVWGHDKAKREHIGILRSCVRRLRQKIEDDTRNPRYIVNRWGEGYRLGE